MVSIVNSPVCFISPGARDASFPRRTVSVTSRVINCSHPSSKKPEPPLSTFEKSRRATLLQIISTGIFVEGSSYRTPFSDASSVSLLPSFVQGSKVDLAIADKCGLGVSLYPDFEYSPVGGGGHGFVSDVSSSDGRVAISFPPQFLNIPAVDFSTTTFLGLPLPPPLKIQISPQVLDGWLDKRTGQVELHFVAQFYFTAGPFYKAAPLFVDTILTTEESRGVSRSSQGSRLNSNGECRLVGVARVPPVDDSFLNNFLMLPTDVLAVLPVRLTFSPTIEGQ